MGMLTYYCTSYLCQDRHTLTQWHIMLYLWHLLDGVIQQASHNQKPTCIHTRAIHSTSPGYECTDKVTPALHLAPRHAEDCHARFVRHEAMGRKHNCRECVLEMNIQSGKKKTWKGTRKQRCVMCSTGTRYCILMCWSTHFTIRRETL